MNTEWIIATVPDAWLITWPIVSMLFTLMMGVVQAWTINRVRQMENLKSELKAITDQLVDAKFATRDVELKTAVGNLNTMMQSILARLEHGDSTFDSLGEKGHKVELTLVSKVEELRMWVMQNCASKADVQRLSDRFDGLQRAVARAEAVYCESKEMT